MTIKLRRSLLSMLVIPMLVLLSSSCLAKNLRHAAIDDIRSVAATDTNKLPIVYSPHYNISFWGLERMHPFDTEKYGRVFSSLIEKKILEKNNYYIPPYPADEVLHRVHSKEYLAELTKSKNIAKFTELHFLTWLPDKTAYNRIMVPARYATAGSILAGELALKHGWSINLGGGYHHASKERYEGFCALADITLSIKHLQDNRPEIKKVMIIDLDAHQGNGHGRDFINDENVFILDIYNGRIYPNDMLAKKGIDHKVELPPYTQDKQYLAALNQALDISLQKFTPDIIYYIAGTDILENDPLGALSVSAVGVIERDHLIFKRALSKNIPIVMLLSGGYQKNNAPLIAHSIESLMEKHNLGLIRNKLF